MSDNTASAQATPAPPSPATTTKPTKHQQQFKFEILGLIRGLLAICVVFVHGLDRFSGEHPKWVTNYHASMVEGFFILSGVVFAIVYEKILLDKRETARGFIVKRFARLYPLGFVMIIFVFIWGDYWGIVPQDKWRPFVWNVSTIWTLTFLVGICPTIHVSGDRCGGINTSMWSLTAEILSYGVFFIILWIIARIANNNGLFCKKNIAFLFYLIATIITYIAMWIVDITSDNDGLGWSGWYSQFQLRCACGIGVFMSGCLIARIHIYVQKVLNFVIKLIVNKFIKQKGQTEVYDNQPTYQNAAHGDPLLNTNHSHAKFVNYNTTANTNNNVVELQSTSTIHYNNNIIINPNNNDDNNTELVDDVNGQHQNQHEQQEVYEARLVWWVDFMRTILCTLIIIGLITLRTILMIPRGRLYWTIDVWHIWWSIILCATQMSDNLYPTLFIQICQFFGNISFSIYIIHMPVFKMIEKATRPPGTTVDLKTSLLGLICALPFMLMVAHCSYTSFEVPVQNLLKKWLLPKRKTNTTSNTTTTTPPQQQQSKEEPTTNLPVDIITTCSDTSKTSNEYSNKNSNIANSDSSENTSQPYNNTGVVVIMVEA